MFKRTSYGVSYINPSGAWETGLFFFISGYGNTLSINKNDNITFDWIFKKLKKIYIPFFVAYCICCVYLAVVDANLFFSKMTIITNLITVTLPNQVSWFPKVILLCFIIHWLAKIVSNNVLLQNGMILFIALIYMIVTKNMGCSDFWYNSIICYPIGCVFAKPCIMNTAASYLRSKRIQSFVASMLLFVIIFILSRDNDVLKLLLAVLFSLVCYYFSYVFRTKSIFLAWIGSNSFEFYLIHVVFIQVFSIMADNNKYLFTTLVFVASCVSVYLYKFVENKLCKW